jgi:2-aminoethylphosphonate-pyruvate transaminase
MHNAAHHVKTAVILAAGRGVRLGKKGETIPKGLLKFSDETLIMRSLNQLFGIGVTKVYVVVGHLAQQYEQVLGQFDSVTTVFNPLYSTSGSMHSLLQVRHLVKEAFFLLESDIIYETRGLSSLLDSRAASALLVSGLTDSGDEVWVQANNGNLSNLSKTIESDEVALGEFVGITKVSASLFEKMCTFALDSEDEPVQMDYEQGLVAASRTEEVETIFIDNYIWGEVDNDEHERRVLTNVLPRIQASAGIIDQGQH